MKIVKRKYFLWFLFIASVLLFGWSVFYSSWLNSASYRKNIQAKFEKKLQSKEVYLRETLEEIISGMENTPGEKIFANTRLSQVTIEKGIIIQAFRDKNPVYWSSNSVSIFPVKDTLHRLPEMFQTENGLYRLMLISRGDITVVGLILIKHNYVYKNQYLQNIFNRQFKVPHGTKLVTNRVKNGFPVNSQEGKHLFSLVFPTEFTLDVSSTLLLLIPFLIFNIFILLLASRVLNRLLKNQKYKWLNFLIYTGFVLIWGFLISYIEVPEKLYRSELFSPVIYASGLIFSSLGALLFNSLLILFIANKAYKSLQELRFNTTHSSVSYNLIRSVLIFIVLIAAYHALAYISASLVVSSQKPFDPGNIEWFGMYGLITLISACFLGISFLLMAFGLFIMYSRSYEAPKELYLYTASALVIVVPAWYVMAGPPLAAVIFVVLFSGLLFMVRTSLLFKRNMNREFLLGMLLICFFYTLQLNDLNKRNEIRKRKAIAEKLTSGRDHFSEFLFSEIQARIRNDKQLADFFSADTSGIEKDEFKLANYLKDKYFGGYWNKYNFLFTFCTPSKILEVKPENYIINCYDFFEDVVEKNGRKTESPVLYYIDNTSINDSYLALIKIETKDNQGGSLFIEFYPKHLPTGLGYPEILSNSEYGLSEDLAEYSWANYENEVLVHYYGTYFYETRLQKKFISDRKFYSYTLDGYDHLIYRPDPDNVFVISRKTSNLTLFSTRFSVLFLSILVTTLLVSLVSGRWQSLSVNVKSFRNRLQFSYIALIILSFIFIGSASFLYLLNLDRQKNNSLLREKAHSVLVELEHKISNLDSASLSSDYLMDILYKFSMVFFTDIHLYDLKGQLIATSRPEIFNQGLIAPFMHPEAYNSMTNLRMTEYIQKEKIGNYTYLSAYLPFYNEKNELIAYINLPYFARQDELKYEISNLLVAFVNIYFLLFVFALMIVLALSRYINKPLELIRRRIASLSLGGTNEKIGWNRDDEIGTLVKEYNRMIDELARSAEMLARSERESAWRQMAQQIAHEIKNPLTPMKLSVQFLYRAWEDKHPDFETRLKKFTQTMNEQIDSLSFTASEFSNFARFNEAETGLVDLRETINKAYDRFRDITTVRFIYQEPAEPAWVLANNERLVRVFHNLINNSVQAIDDENKGQISIRIKAGVNEHIIEFSDNGSGIPDEVKERIFSPYFTTKSGGTGLGLSIVKNILSTYGGSIEFNSSAEKGTTFIIRIPAAKEG